MSQLARQPGQVFLDARGGGRAMRLTWHHEADLVVLSLWRDHVCAGTFRLPTSEVSDFVDALVDGLRGAPGVSISRGAAPTPEALAPTDVMSPSLPPRQRRPGSHAAWAPERPSVAAHAHRFGPHSESAGEDQETFTDWAFGARGAHRASAG
jgi:hypothetical protein